jgi:hypothetical protein
MKVQTRTTVSMIRQSRNTLDLEVQKLTKHGKIS